MRRPAAGCPSALWLLQVLSLLALLVKSTNTDAGRGAGSMGASPYALAPAPRQVLSLLALLVQKYKHDI